MSMFYENLSRVIRQERIAKGYTQRQVAEALNINRATVTYYEMGKTRPDILTLRKLAELFSVSMDVFCYPEKYEKIQK